MTDERWARVKAVFHAVVERPAAERAAYLAAAVGDDHALRGEVESLLAADGGLSASNGFPALAEASAEPHPALLPGHRLGSYEVVATLGAGGMGEVYRARDTKLSREVALKVLPQLFAADAGWLARFRREAQLLAALSHPNIAAIYGVEESTNLQALVLELVEGRTLAQRIADGAIPVSQALPIAKQVAEALEAAHEKGIVHRDLKPANIKVRPDDVVKVLDFGLAKMLASEPAIHPPDGDAHARESGIAATREGLIAGTAAYMAPEQAKGLPVDTRADIWAYGCVMFEMLAGRPAFRGESVTDLIAAVVNDDPDWTALPRTLPSGVHTLLRRCLKKDPRQRLQAIGDARLEIDAIVETLGGEARPTAASSISLARKPWLPWVAVVAIAAAVAGWEVWRSAAPPEEGRAPSDYLIQRLANVQFSRLTDWDGTEGGAVISPDGRFIAFVADRAGELDIWVHQIGTEIYRNLTADIPPMQQIGHIFRKLGFSADGSQVWFTPESGPSMAQMMLPFTGGRPRPFLEQNATAPAWSPDGRRLTYFRNEDGDPLFVADGNGMDARQILSETSWHHHNPVWSSDGEWIYVARGLEPTAAMDVWRVRPSGQSLERLTDRRMSVNLLAPLDARTLLYVARAADGSGPWLWALDVERRLTRQVTTGVGNYTSVSVDRAGRRVVATVANPTTNLWRAPLLDRQIEDRDVQAYPVPTSRALAPRFAGTSLFYLSGRGSNNTLWRVRDGQAFEVSKGGDAGLSEPPAVSPDGSRAAIVVRKDGKRNLVIVSADGRTSRTLESPVVIEGQAGQAAADWSPDGSWIVVGGRDTQGIGLFKIPVDGGAPIRLVAGEATHPVWSPQGDLIVYGGRFFTGQVDVLGVRPDGTPVAMPGVRARPGGYRFLPDGTGLVYLPTIPSLDFWRIDFATKAHRQLTRLSNRGTIGVFDITPDGTAIVFDRARENSDIVLIEVSKQ